jgi:hypothetical protein
MDGRTKLIWTLHKRVEGCGMNSMAQVKFTWSALAKLEINLLVP